MMRTKTPAAALQKTYDDCHLVCSTAIYFESQNNEVEALRCWKNALEQINYHNAFRIPSTYHPRTETEKALQASLRDLELQCKERVDLLGALDRSRRDASANSTISDTPRPLAKGENESWLGSGTIPPLNYPDLARPPALPTRPSKMRSSSSESATLPRAVARPASPSPLRTSSRTPSPEKKIRMRSTLRPLFKPRNTSSSSSYSAVAKDRPPSAAKAATLAWSSIGSPHTKASEELSAGYGLKTNPPSHLPIDDRPPRQIGPRLNRRRMGDEKSHARDSTASDKTHETGKSPLPQLGRSTHLDESPAFKLRHSDVAHRADKNTQRELLRSRHLQTRSPAALLTASDHASTSKGYGKQAIKSPNAGPDTSNLRKKSNVRTTPAARKVSASNGQVRGSSGFAIPRKPVRHRGLKTYGAEDSSPDRLKEDLGLCSDDELRESESYSSESTPSSSDADEKSWERMATQVLENLPRGIDSRAAEQILNEVIIQGDEVHWGDIAGLEVAKSALKETVVYPFLRPDLFMGLREPARGMLLFGPPGTGKTMLARAVATESKSTFFAISASSLTSKFLGESEKLVRALFTLAKMLAPSIIFVDEIDSLLSSRNESGEHEASRRIKTEFLIQWSDLARAAAGRDQSAKEKERGDASRVLVLAATNSPWAIDDAARRRFVRRQYIPLPEEHVRHLQLKTLLAHQKHQLTDQDIAKLVGLTDGFSGSDITALAKDAAMGPLRSLGEKLLHMTMDEIGPIHLDDFIASLGNIRPSVSKEGLQRFEDWARDFGERGG